MGGLIGLTTGSFSGYKYAKDNDLNPWTGRNPIEEFAHQNNFYSNHKGTINSEKVYDFLQKMEKGMFDLESSKGAGFYYDDKIIFSDGHHRMNAAIKYYLKTGNDIYIKSILNTNQFYRGSKYHSEIYPFRALKK